MNKLFHLSTAVRGLVVGAIAVMAMSACSMMHDDRDYCPDGLYVRFVYDYNLQRADMFKDHVGSLTLFVFDENGYFVKQQEVTNSDTNTPLKQYGYTMHVDGLAPGRYQMITLANQNNAATSGNTKYQWADLQKGDSMSVLKTILNRSTEVDSDGYYLVDNSAPMDTLWHGMDATTVEVRAGVPTYDTISLVRDTKNLNLTLRQLKDPNLCAIQDYDIYITDANGMLLYDNTVADDGKLKYKPYAQWNSYYSTDGTVSDIVPPIEGDIQQEVAHANIAFNRLMYRNSNDNPAMLYVRNNKTDVMVLKANLSNYLAEGRNAYDYFHYSPQEYLDRAYDYNLELVLVGDTWEYVEISIAILSWTVRIQNENL